MYIFFPVILEFVGERYKNMSTIKYALFVSCMFVLVYCFICITGGGSFISNKIEMLLIVFGILFTTTLFYLQKKYRGIR
jgi:hypothetical protein